jgi:hypothetical protein
MKRNFVLAVLSVILTCSLVGCDEAQAYSPSGNTGEANAQPQLSTASTAMVQPGDDGTDGCIVKMCGDRLCCSQIYQKGQSIGIGTTDIPDGDKVYVEGTVHAYSAHRPALKGISGTDDGVFAQGGHSGISAWSQNQCGARLGSHLGWAACAEGDGGILTTGHNGPGLKTSSIEIVQPTNIQSQSVWVDVSEDGEFGCPDGMMVSKILLAAGKVSRILCKGM